MARDTDIFTNVKITSINGLDVVYSQKSRHGWEYRHLCNIVSFDSLKLKVGRTYTITQVVVAQLQNGKRIFEWIKAEEQFDYKQAQKKSQEDKINSILSF